MSPRAADAGGVSRWRIQWGATSEIRCRMGCRRSASNASTLPRAVGVVQIRRPEGRPRGRPRRRLRRPDGGPRSGGTGAAAADWCRWEDLVPLGGRRAVPGASRRPHSLWRPPLGRAPRARTDRLHYFANGAWLKEDAPLRDAECLKGIPGVLPHGRLDLSSPPDTAGEAVGLPLIGRSCPGTQASSVVVISRRRSASTPSSALESHTPDPSRFPIEGSPTASES
jgi:hypothetical protein